MRACNFTLGWVIPLILSLLLLGFILFPVWHNMQTTENNTTDNKLMILMSNATDAESDITTINQNMTDLNQNINTVNQTVTELRSDFEWLTVNNVTYHQTTHNLDLIAGSGIVLIPDQSSNSIMINSTITGGANATVISISGTPADPSGDVNLDGGLGITISPTTPGANDVQISTSAVLDMNGVVPDGVGNLDLVGIDGITITPSTPTVNDITIGTDAIRTLNGNAADGSNNVIITGGDGITVNNGPSSNEITINSTAIGVAGAGIQIDSMGDTSTVHDFMALNVLDLPVGPYNMNGTIPSGKSPVGSMSSIYGAGSLTSGSYFNLSPMMVDRPCATCYDGFSTRITPTNPHVYAREGVFRISLSVKMFNVPYSVQKSIRYDLGMCVSSIFPCLNANSGIVTEATMYEINALELTRGVKNDILFMIPKIQHFLPMYGLHH